VEAWAVVVAGGTGTRFGARKQYESLAGRPVVAWSLDQARRCCAGVVLVLPADDVGRREWPADLVVAGGSSRSASVRAGLAAVPASAGIIAVHDAARPLARDSIWHATLDAVRRGADAAIPTVQVTDTIKQIQPDGSLLTLDRSRLVAVQTPQAFRASVLRQAHASGRDATDDAALVEAIGGTVVRVDGAPDNLKVTDPGDLTVAATLLGEGTLAPIERR
jgi:2-C-methyl-D-erythritol 4-phosphate cytidylyltransferase